MLASCNSQGISNSNSPAISGAQLSVEATWKASSKAQESTHQKQQACKHKVSIDTSFWKTLQQLSWDPAHASLFKLFIKTFRLFFICQTQSRCSSNVRSNLMALKGKPRKSLAEEEAPDCLLQDVGVRSKVKWQNPSQSWGGRGERKRLVKSLGCYSFPAKQG